MGLMDGIIGSALDFFGKSAEDKYISDPNSADAYQRQKEFYKHRYQWMMDDMASAGLNPILAAGSAGFNTGGTPSVAQSQLPQGSYSSAYESIQKGNLAEEQEKTEKVEQLKKMAEVKTEIENKYKIRAEKGLANETERSIWFSIEKLQSEVIKNMKQGFLADAEKELMKARLKQLKVELQRLKNVNTIYSNPASMALSIIREIANSLGLNIGVVAPMKGK